MKAVLLSIQPKWCELIASGKKTIEVRKTRPKIDTPFKCYIYCTKQGKLFFHGKIGEKECLFKNPDTGKIKFDYSFELMCCKNEYTKDNFLSGKVIGEFVCDDIDTVQVFNDILYCVKNSQANKLKQMCLTIEEVKAYLGANHGFNWHISGLKIYDKPKDLSEFYTFAPKYTIKDGVYSKVLATSLKKPPQSWCYVESLGE